MRLAGVPTHKRQEGRGAGAGHPLLQKYLASCSYGLAGVRPGQGQGTPSCRNNLPLIVMGWQGLEQGRVRLAGALTHKRQGRALPPAEWKCRLHTPAPPVNAAKCNSKSTATYTLYIAVCMIWTNKWKLEHPKMEIRNSCANWKYEIHVQTNIGIYIYALIYICIDKSSRNRNICVYRKYIYLNNIFNYVYVYI